MLYTVSKRALIFTFAALLTTLVFTVHDNVIYAQSERITLPAGAEVFAGSLEQNTGNVYGSTITMNSAENGTTHHLTVSFDYTLGGDRFPIISGSWTLVTMMDGGYAGTVYGTVRTGKVTPIGTFAPPNEPPAGPRDLSIELVTTGSIAGSSIQGPFERALLEARSDGQSISGTLTPFF